MSSRPRDIGPDARGAEELTRILAVPELEILAAGTPGLAARAALFLAHRFDLLGSGWVSAAYGASAAGLAGHVYPPQPAPRVDRGGLWLRDHVAPAELSSSREAWRLVSDGYEPIDWHRDLKSGYRWPALVPSPSISWGDAPGADVKVPWELARMQHLPQLALAFHLARAGAAGLAEPTTYAAEVRDQVLDFVAANPPGFGVHWHCSMDVAIRAVNWLVADDLLRAAGAGLDRAYRELFQAGILAHASHLVAHPQSSEYGNHNHYFAEVVGLLFLAAYLPRTRQTDAWLAFAAAELSTEAAAQFLADGADFEASTAYHLLVTEMLLFGAVLVLAVAGERRLELTPGDLRWLPAPQRQRLAARPPTAREALLARLGGVLARAARFLAAATAPDGELIQIGDCDSGRLLKLAPVTAGRDERHLASGPLLAALAAVGAGETEVPADQRGPARLLAALVAGATGGRKLPVPAPSPQPTSRAPRPPPPAPVESSEIRLIVAGGSLDRGLATAAFPDFGLFVLRSPRLYLTLRCGLQGFGSYGHAHVDQLSLGVYVDGEPWIRDPGSYVYTPLAATRDAYRSSRAHFVPYAFADEAPLFAHGLWRLDLDAELVAWSLADRGVDVELLLAGHRLRAALRVAGGEVLLRTVRLAAAPAAPELTLRGGTWTHPDTPPAAVAFSPGYGLQQPRD